MRTLLGIAAVLWSAAAAAGPVVGLDQTFVSGVGDDAYPCERTAPCKTLAAALFNTAPGGEITVLDTDDLAIGLASDGITEEFKPVVIDKAVTIDALYASGPVTFSAAGGAIEVAAGPSDVVVLRGLSIDGRGLGASGITFASGGALELESCFLSGFTSHAVDFEPAAGGSLMLQDVILRNSGGAGLLILGSATAPAVATLVRSSSEANQLGYAAGPNARLTAYQSYAWGNTGPGVVAFALDGSAAEINLDEVALAHNGLGIQAYGAGAVVRVSEVRLDSGGGLCTRISGAASIPSFHDNSIACGSCSVSGAIGGAVAGGATKAALFTVDGAIGSPSYSLSGELPSGMSFNQGVLSGTPGQQGTFPFTVSVSDGNGCSASVTESLVVACPASAVDPGVLLSATTGVAYAPVTFTQPGAVGAASLSIAGALPVGMIRSGATLSGKPRQPGSFPLTVSATDAAGCIATAALTLVVVAASDYQATTLTLLASASPVSFGSPLALTANVASGAGEPTGSMNFYDGDTLIGSVAVAAHAASLSPSLGVGLHALRASYSGDDRFGPSDAALSVAVDEATFEVVAQATDATFNGTSASYTLAATVHGALAAPVTFACSGLPAGLQCRFDVASISATANLSLQVGGSTLAALRAHPLGASSTALALVLLPALAGLRRRKRAWFTQMFAALALLAATVTGCDTGSPQRSTMAPGTYPFTVTASSGARQVGIPLRLIVN